MSNRLFYSLYSYSIKNQQIRHGSRISGKSPILAKTLAERLRG